MAGGGQGAAAAQAGQQLGQLMSQQTPAGAMPNPYGTSASPTNQGFMQYQGQGQPNQPQGITPGTPPPAFGATPQNQNFMSGPDTTGNLPGGSQGFDNSGSDGGVGGQPAPMQSPLQQGNKPLGLGQFQQPQGLQIQGNPTSQVVQRPQQR